MAKKKKAVSKTAQDRSQKIPVDAALRRINLCGHTNLGTSVKVTVLVNSFLSMTSLPNANTELTPLNSTFLIVKDFKL